MTGSWVEYAACRNHHADLWFADPGHETGQQALQICADCPVILKCLDYAITTNQQHGIWGGLTDTERANLHRAINDRPLAPVRHGTVGGYQAHRRRRETPCDPCKAARAQQNRERRNQLAQEASNA